MKLGYKELIEDWESKKKEWYTSNKEKIKSLFDVVTVEDNKDFRKKIIANVRDLDDLHQSDGFYMILNDEINDGDCLEITNGSKTYRCVYRGESTELKDRLISHLFNDSAKPKYTTCMKVNDKYVDLSNGNLNLSGLVVTYGMNGSTSEFRRMFEKAFDEKYGRPKYSIEK